MFEHHHEESEDRGPHRGRPVRRAGVVRVSGHRFQPLHGVRRVRAGVPDRRHPDGDAGRRPEDASRCRTPPAFSAARA